MDTNPATPPASELPLAREDIERQLNLLSGWEETADAPISAEMYRTALAQSRTAIELMEQRNEARHWLGVEVEKNNQLLKWQRDFEAREAGLREALEKVRKRTSTSDVCYKIIMKALTAPAPTAVLVEKEKL